MVPAAEHHDDDRSAAIYYWNYAPALPDNYRRANHIGCDHYNGSCQYYDVAGIDDDGRADLDDTSA